MSADKTYSDTGDDAIISTTPSDLFAEWDRFESNIFDSLNHDANIHRRNLLNAGAGRRITDTESPFFGSFAQLYLLEPDTERRAALAQDVVNRNAVLLVNRLEQIDATSLSPMDFVQCKYVLQHIHTDLLPIAVAKLKSVVAEGGTIGIFSTLSQGKSFFQMTIPNNAEHLIPSDLRPDSNGYITETQFNRLMSSPPNAPFIASHYIAQQTLLSYFADWNPRWEIGPANVCFMRAQKPTANAQNGQFSRAKKFLRKLFC